MNWNFRYAKEKEGGGKFKPPAGAQSAAKKALQWISEGHAGDGFTSVGRTRAHQLANREELTLSTVKRMHSFFSRHRVDKQGKDWNKPSPGKVAWYAWGGDAGASWAAGIVKKHSVKTSMNWNQRYANLMDSVRGGPCTGKSECGTCMDLDEVINDLAETDGSGKLTPKARINIDKIKSIKQLHQDLRVKK